MTIHDSIERSVPREIQSSLRRLGRESTILQVLYISLGIVAIIAPLSVASFTDLLSSITIRVVSFAGAVAVGLIGGFQLAQKANNLRQAYFELKASTLRYCADPSISEKRLIEEYETILVSRRVASIDGPGIDHPKMVGREHHPK